MNILIQYAPRSIALRSAGTDPFALIFRHTSREEGGNPCVVEFLPWKDVQARGEYQLLNSIEVHGCLGLIDIDEGICPSIFLCLRRYIYLRYNRTASGRVH